MKAEIYVQILVQILVVSNSLKSPACAQEAFKIRVFHIQLITTYDLQLILNYFITILQYSRHPSYV